MGKKILIVDDSLLAEHALKSYFVKLGHEVVGLAKSGEIGKQMFEDLQPDLVTVDAVMPGISGQEYVKYLNDHDQNNGTSTKILMISGDPIPEEDKKILKVDKYIIKPVTLKKIKDTLEDL